MTTRGIVEVQLRHFRNYDALNLNCSPGPMVIYGDNGVGKTNILEALSLFSPGKGFRNSKLSQMTRMDAPCPWGVSIQLQLPDATLQLGTGLEITPQGSEKRIIRKDGNNLLRQTALGDWLSIVWLTPQMGRLFLDPSLQRRKFIDRLTYAFVPRHVEDLQRYEHAMTERSTLLRQRQFDPRWLDPLEDVMAEKACAIAANRQKAIDVMAQNQTDDLPFPKFHGKMIGDFERWLEEDDLTTVHQQLRRQLSLNRPIDAEAGGSRIGPHRSDLEIRHELKQLSASFCSTGEQKMLLLSIMLAFVRAQQKETDSDWKRATIFLLDDVVAHLDQNHRDVLFDEVCRLGVQAWMTGTDREAFAPLKDRAQFLRIHDAQQIEEI